MKRNLLYLFLGLVLITSCKKQHSQPPSPGRMIKSFQLAEGQFGSAKIYTEDQNYKVLVKLQVGANLTNVKPIIEISDDAVITPASGQALDITTNKKVIYTVTAASGESRTWEVEFRIYSSAITDYDTYSISSVVDNRVMQVTGNMLFNERYLDNAAIGVGNAEINVGENLKRWQEWHIIYNSTAGGVKYYQIRNLHSGLYLNGGATSTAGLQIKQKEELKTNIDPQLWKIEEGLQPGKYEISNKANGLFLAESGTGSNLLLTQEAKLEVDKQKWFITKLPSDSYRDSEFNNFLKRTTGSVAFDQGNSIPLADGRVLWVTQDAFNQVSMKPNGFMDGNHTVAYSNSIIIQPAVNNWNSNAPMMTVDGGDRNGVGNIMPKQPGKQWSWPSAGVQIGDKVYISNREGTGLGDANDNSSLFILTPITDTKWQAVRTTPPGLKAAESYLGYASGMIKANDGFVYVYGSRAQPNSFGSGTFLYVARYPQSNPQDWTFWNGTAWTTTASIEPTAHLLIGKGTNYVAYSKGKYIHLTMDQGFFCGIASVSMYISTSSSPTGPFTPRKLVHTFTEFYKGYNAKIYTPLIHTHADNGKNELLVTYSMNYGACDGQNNPLKESDNTYDPYYYRVKGVRIPYEMIGL